MITKFRDTVRRISPRWLQAHWGSRLLYSFGIHLDTWGDALTYGVKARFPNVYSAESLGVLGRDRQITRGLFETDETYGARLTRWLDDHRRRGNPYTLMRQIQAFLAPYEVPMHVVTKGAWYSLDGDGYPSYTTAPGVWDWNNQPESWSRFWIILYPSPELWVADGAWTSATPWTADGTVFGCNATVAQVESIRSLVADWRGPHARCVNIIVSFDEDAFNPDSAPLPDGTWGHYWDTASLSANRDPRGTYWKGA